MPGIYFNRQDAAKARADLWEHDARQRLADAWETNTRLRLPTLLEDAQAKLQRVVHPDLAAGGPAAPVSVAGLPQAPAAISTQPPAMPATPGASSPQPSGDYQSYARQAAARAGVDPETFVRQIQQESNFDPNAGSPAGARGIAQIVPQYHPGVDVTDPYASLDYAANLMASHLKTYGGDVSKALVAYNGGQGAVDALNAGTPYQESQQYLSKILGGGGQQAAAAPATDNQAAADQWEKLALAQTNKPYIWGSGSGAGGRGTQDIDPNTGQPRGFDCSGFVSWVLKNGLGIDLPAQTASAYTKTSAVDPRQAQPGDVVFYNMNQSDPHQQHIALYMGDGQIIQAGGTQSKVNVADVNALGAPEFRRPEGEPARQTVGMLSQVAGQGADQGPAANIARGTGTPPPPNNPQVTTNPLENAGNFFSGLGSAARGAADAAGRLLDPNAPPLLSGAPVNPLAGPLNASLGTSMTAAPLPPGASQEPSAAELVRQAERQRYEWTREHNPARDVPVLGGIINQATDPLMYLNLTSVAGNVAGGALSGYYSTPPGATPAELALNTGTGAAMGGGIAAGVKGVSHLAASPEVQAALRTRQQAQATPEFASGGLSNLVPGRSQAQLELQAAEAQLAALRTRYPQLTEGSVAASALGKQVQQLRAQVAAEAPLLTPQIPNANRARALGADRAAAAEGLPTREARLTANDVYGGAEPPTEVRQAFTRTPQGDIVPLNDTPGADALRGMIQMAKQRGVDTSAVERQLNFQEKMAQILRGKEPAQVNLAMVQPGPVWLQSQHAAQPLLPGIQPAASSLADKAVTVRYAGLLANWYTQIGNILGDSGQAFVQPIRLAASGHPGEAVSYLRGMGESVGTANINAANVLASGVAPAASKAQFSRSGAFGTGPLGQVMDASGNFMASADTWFQTIAKGGFVKAQAARDARGNPQLHQQLWQNPSPTTLAAADRFARTATYSEDPGRIVNWLSERGGLSDAERVGVTLLVPFLRTTTNILRRGLSFTAKPVTGSVGAIGKLIQGDTRGASFDAADALLSSVVLAGFAAKASKGELSGEGPTDPGERRLLVSQGWQPHSIRIGDRWYDYSFAGPLAVPASLVANWSEGMAEGKVNAPADEQANRMVNRLSKSVLRQTFLSNIGDLFDDRGGGAVGVLQNLIATTVAPSVLRDVAQVIDPYERKPQQGLVGGTLGRIGERIPGVSQLVPAEQDVLGRPLASRRGGIPQPIRSSQVHPDALINAFDQAGMNISVPRDTITLGQGARSVQVRVQPDEQRRWNSYRGEMLQRIGGGFINSPEFTRIPLPVRQKVLRQMLDSASQYATGHLASELPDLNARLGDAINEKIAEAGGTVQPAATATGGGMSAADMMRQTELRAQQQADAQRQGRKRAFDRARDSVLQQAQARGDMDTVVKLSIPGYPGAQPLLDAIQNAVDAGTPL
jgi:cell wall-associated NlpC family hydrolase